MWRIVIADDHEIVRNGLKTLLEDAGWQVCGEARNGEEAVEKVYKLQPDLAILDISMPVMNGLQAAQAIREHAPEIKIALFTMHDLTPFKNPSFAYHADAYLMKTARSERIVQTISQLLK
jgi:DNA-binding NarL/FixJ family response regulator